MDDAPCAVVVDDAPSTRQRVAVLLQLAGWRVYGVAGMPEALRAVAQLEPDLVITEARVRRGSGLALAGQLRRNGYRARCLLLTARPTDRLREQAAALGAGCLAKPLDPGQLIDFLGEDRSTPRATDRGPRLRVSAERVPPAARPTAPDDDRDEPHGAEHLRDLHRRAVPHQLAWITARARAGDANVVIDEAGTVIEDGYRADAARRILSQPRLLQMLLLASATGRR